MAMYRKDWDWEHIKNILNSNGREWAPLGDNIQKALDDLLTDGGFVFSPARILTINSTLLVPNNTKLFGAGWASILRAANGLNARMIENADPTGGNHDIVIADLQLDGNKANQTSGASVAQAVRFTRLTRAVLRDLYVHDVHTDGLVLENACFDGAIKDCVVEDCGVVFPTGTGIVVSDATVQASERCRLVRCHVQGCTYAGCDLENSVELTVRGGEYLANNMWGVRLYGSNRSIVGLAHVLRNGYDGIEVRGARNVVIGNRVLDNDYENTAAYDGIVVRGDDNLIIGNVCRDNDRYEINIESGWNNSVFVNAVEGADHVGTINDTGNQTRIGLNMYGAYRYTNENWGTAKILNGTASISVPHRLVGTPTVVVVTGRDIETDRVRCSARDGTNITLSVPADVTADSVVDWHAFT